MTYNPNIPQSGDDPTASQAQILANFGAINTDFSQNHTALNSGGYFGFHTQINFPNGIADPNLSSPQSSAYPKLQLQTNTIEYFFQNGNSFNNVRQLTNLPVVNGKITNISISGSTVTVTTANRHLLTTGNQVTFYNIYGSTQLNGNNYIITVTANNQFQVTQAGVSAYIGGGYYIVTNPSNFNNYGVTSPWNIIFNMGRFTNNNPNGTGTIYYSVPFTSICYFVGLTSNTTNTIGINPNVTTNTTILDHFDYANATVPSNLFYLAIGK